MIENFLWAESIEHAVQLKKDNPEAKFIAGGTWINNFDNKEKPKTVIGLERLKLNKICFYENSIEIQSGAVIQDIIENEDTPEILIQALRNIPSRNIRNIATIGGEIALKSNLSNLIPTLVALKSSLMMADGEKMLVEDYVKSNHDGLITSVIIPLEDNRFIKIEKFSRTKTGTPLLQIATSLELEGDKSIKDIVIAIGGIKSFVYRDDKLESELEGMNINSKKDIEKTVKKFIQAESDYRASKEFREYITSVLIAQSICDAVV
jgi:putative selenate reductase FAD-binding subunit